MGGGGYIYPEAPNFESICLLFIESSTFLSEQVCKHCCYIDEVDILLVKVDISTYLILIIYRTCKKMKSGDKIVDNEEKQK